MGKRPLKSSVTGHAYDRMLLGVKFSLSHVYVT